MQKLSISCIKCGTKYKTTDPDPYLCEACLVEKERIAKEVDEQFKDRVSKKPTSGLKLYDSLPKNSNGFVRAKDLGL